MNPVLSVGLVMSLFMCNIVVNDTFQYDRTIIGIRTIGKKFINAAMILFILIASANPTGRRIFGNWFFRIIGSLLYAGNLVNSKASVFVTRDYDKPFLYDLDMYLKELP